MNSNPIKAIVSASQNDRSDNINIQYQGHQQVVGIKEQTLLERTMLTLLTYQSGFFYKLTFC
jgi:hypothetical protein